MTDFTNHFDPSTDRPITSRQEDILDRKIFAASLAKSISGWKHKDSLVVALFGRWGSGKTSIKNMVLESLKNNADSPKIVPFNPWQLADCDRLNSAFFQEIGNTLGHEANSNECKKASLKLIKYEAYLKTGTHIFYGIRILIKGLIRWISLVIIISGLAIDFASMKPYVLRIISGIGVLIFISTFFEKTSEWLSGLFEKRAAIQAAKAQIQEKGLEERKSEISALLKKIPNPILIVIDDVDRLTHDEIRHLFQLIKANADFPNLIYLILCDQEVVEESLDQLIPGKGKEYLKKIIQVPFNIPQIKREKIKQLFFDGLREALKGCEDIIQFDSRWDTMFDEGINHYFQTIRDVNRYMNSLSFHFSQFQNENTLEVNAVDVIALEVLRVFEGDVYKKLYEGKLFLTDRYLLSTNKEADESFKQELSKSANNKEIVNTLLKELFPISRWEKDPLMDTHADEGELLKHLRVGHPQMFHRYFTFTIPEDEISQADVRRVLNHSENKELLLKDFRSYMQRGLLGELLERLTVNLAGIESGDSVIFISTLFEVGDESKDGKDNLQIDSLVQKLLQEEGDIDARYELLKSSIESSQAIVTPTFQVFRQLQAYSQNSETSSLPENSKEKLESLKEVCIPRIREGFHSGRLRRHPERKSLLAAWEDWTSIEEVKKWVKQEIQEREGLFSFINTYIGKGTMGQKPQKYINRPALEKFTSIQELEQKLSEVPSEELSYEENEIITIFKQSTSDFVGM
ncbi:KAP family P-loop NTPase fold protein [Candidatus Nitrospira salsa]